MAVPKNGVYKVLKFPKVGPIATRTPSFPSTCPHCRAKRRRTTHEETFEQPEDRTAVYECGGIYGRLESNDPMYNFYSGQCPIKAKESSKA